MWKGSFFSVIFIGKSVRTEAFYRYEESQRLQYFDPWYETEVVFFHYFNDSFYIWRERKRNALNNFR